MRYVTLWFGNNTIQLTDDVGRLYVQECNITLYFCIWHHDEKKKFEITLVRRQRTS